MSAKFSLANPGGLGQLASIMSGLEKIEQTLERTARRRRLERGLHGLWRGIFWGAVVFLGTLAVYKLQPIPVASLAVAGILSGLIMLGGFVAGWWRKPSHRETALKERLSTALEVGADQKSGRWRDLVLQDAVRHADSLNPRELLPFHLTRLARWSVLVLVLAAGLGFVPEYRSKAYLEAKNDEAIIKEAGRVLAELTKRTLEQKPPVMEPTEKALQAVNETGLELSKAGLKRDDALQELANVADKLSEQMKEMAKNPALRKMDQALRRQDSRSAAAASTPGEMQKKLDELQKALGETAQQQEALEKMQSELAAMQQKAAQMSNEPGGLSEEAKQEMARQLAEMSQQAQQMGMNLPGLEAAMEALLANQTDFFLKDLELALNDLEKLQQMAEAMQQLQQELAKLGKDLAEQLQFGQANAAIDSLKKMMEQLQQSGLSEEQMAKLMDELAKSLKPAQDYGKVADKLAKALGQCKAGDSSGAGESLAAAAKELEELLAQMGDMESMMATLEALKMAQMCVGNGLGFGQCRGGGSGWKPGGKLGRGGFGTWADENGLTDRVDGELVDGTTPTKVRGQMSPGGNMPSITLKGVSIKGTSQVDYQQAVAAAQSDAQSALADDKVPRAYQGAVRDYFDDLK
jgi:cob(I)alamin adenosyltransferase